jgi:hypothetical protein
MKNLLMILFVVFTVFMSWSQNSANELNTMRKGFYNRLSIGLLAGSDVSASFQVVNGYQWNEHWSTGFGIGLENPDWDPHVPLFLEGNYHFLKSQTGPRLNLLAGYQLPTRSLGDRKGGVTVGGKIGFDFAITRNIGLMTSVGYRYIHLESEFWNPWNSVVQIRDMNRLDFRVGFIFR